MTSADPGEDQLDAGTPDPGAAAEDTGPSDPSGAQLLRNPGFEEGLEGWEVLAGAPEISAGRPGVDPAEGSSFLYGGDGEPGDALVRQGIDLIEAGFSAEQLDAGVMLRARAALRTWIGLELFDDQAFLRVVWLDAGGEELGAIRTTNALGPRWEQAELVAWLPAGTRALKVDFEARQRRGRENDGSADDLSVVVEPGEAPSDPAITKLPMLQDVRPDFMSMIWETDGPPAVQAIRWGKDDVSEHRHERIETIQIDREHFVHRAAIGPLDPETRYRYEVVVGAASSGEHSFRSPPLPQSPVRLVVSADNQSGYKTFEQVVPAMAAHDPDLLLMVGDIVNQGSSLEDWHQEWFKPLEKSGFGQSVPVMFARGNHDGEHAYAYAYSTLPGNESWYAFSWGRARVIVLDSEVPTEGAPEQREWLLAELGGPESGAAAFRIVAFHKPPFTNLWGHEGYSGESWVREQWVEIFESHGVDLVLCGHTHGYLRGERNGVTYAIVGGAGGSLDTYVLESWDLFDLNLSEHNFNIIDIDDRSLSFTSYSLDERVLDQFELSSGAE